MIGSRNRAGTNEGSAVPDAEPSGPLAFAALTRFPASEHGAGPAVKP